MAQITGGQESKNNNTTYQETTKDSVVTTASDDPDFPFYSNVYKKAYVPIKIYPDSITDEIHIELSEEINNKYTIVEIKDTSGELLYRAQMLFRMQKIHTAEFKDGTYFLTVNYEGGMVRKEITLGW